jgi:hypothetical protein
MDFMEIFQLVFLVLVFGVGIVGFMIAATKKD